MAKNNNLHESYREGGWGWAVVLSAFLAHFIGFGTVKALGVMITVMADDLDTELWIVGSISSWFVAVELVLVPFAAAAARKFGIRRVVTFGGVLYAVGLILASMSPNVIVLTLTLVVLAGTGSACVFEMTRAAIMYYFHERYSLANSIACMGDPSGMIVYGPVAQLLLETYGWRGVMLLLGGVGCHLIVCGLLVKPPAKSYSRLSNPVVINPTEEVASETARPPSKQTRRTFRSLLSSGGLEFLMDVEFIILTFTRIFANTAYVGVVVYMVPNGLMLGLSAKEASILTSAWGLGNISGYVISGLLVQSKRISTHAVSVIGLVSVVCLVTNQYMTSLVAQMVNLALIGFGISNLSIVASVLTRNMSIADDQLFVVFCWQSSLSGLVTAVGGVISGWLYDVTGTFLATFLWCAGNAVASVLSIIVHYVYIWKRDRVLI